MKKPIRNLFCAAVLMAATIAVPATAAPGAFHDFNRSPTTTEAGVSGSYTIEFGNHFPDNSVAPFDGAEARIIVTFAAGFDLSGAQFDASASRLAVGPADQIAISNTFNTAGELAPASNATIDPVARTLTITGLSGDIIGTTGSSGTPYTAFRVVINGVQSPAVPGNAAISTAFQRNVAGAWTPLTSGISNVSITVPPGVVLGANPAAPLTYARELIATSTNPLILTNLGPQNLRVPLTYNLSASEVRHARLECGSGMVFQPGTAVLFGGSASVGAVNGIGTSAITFSVTAGAAGASGTGYLNASGNRSIAGTDPVDCTYSLYDFPSQAQAGGSAGRVATVSGAYLRFASSTAFTSTGRISTANVEADPAYTRFVASTPTTLGVAALSRLTYSLGSPAPLTAAGTPIALTNLHATGASGTRIVAAGDFTSAANANGSYTSDALNRVYLSTSNVNCTTVGIPAATLSATQATFPVGATATDRMLCLAPRVTVAIPASNYATTLDATSAQPTVYAVPDIGPLGAGQIMRNGTELQAPLVQVPAGWIARLALTNTGTVARTYAIRVMSANADGSTAIETFDLADDLKTGSIPAGGTKVIRLDAASLAAAARRGTVIVTVSGPNNQIQGLYQVVNPNTGLVTNHVMVRPGSN
ncbi:hypothetical protein [Luteimonas sp. 3794]|uniref:hypothetical protein n=1 Tax=Luteimonas sp. 3794 TaxID=2817730 RepID=UPI00286789E2|nr:hypothetical protein [Luteimonas sp. 3794]MDR6991849.1 hypothetical protein [Luteimonas sp. 3794]